MILAVKSKYMNSEFHQRRVQREADAKLRVTIALEEKLRKQLLVALYSELVSQKSLRTVFKNTTEQTSVVYFLIKRKYEKELMEVLKHRDFVSFNITVVKENNDVLTAITDLPIMLRCSKKQLGEEVLS